MVCLSCGNCCKAISPKGDNCSNLIYFDGVCLCADYKYRPIECSSHRYCDETCPIGLNTLDIERDNYEAINTRLKVVMDKINILKDFKNNC